MHLDLRLYSVFVRDCVGETQCTHGQDASVIRTGKPGSVCVYVCVCVCVCVFGSVHNVLQ